MEFKIRNLVDSDLTEIQRIFFENSSRKSFSDETQKRQFFERWLGVYLQNFADETFVACTDDSRVLGYLAGCQNSSEGLKTIGEKLTSYKIFERQFKVYPAHFHINISSQAQGMGVGKKLIEHYFHFLKFKKISGVHVVTSQGEPNIDFYKKLNFEISDRQLFQDWELLLMGHLL